MSYKTPYFAYGKQPNKLNYKTFKLGGFMENLMKFYRWMGKSYPVFQPSSISIQDDTYNGGTSFDGW